MCQLLADEFCIDLFNVTAELLNTCVVSDVGLGIKKRQFLTSSRATFQRSLICVKKLY
jgi:hypothetical protein